MIFQYYFITTRWSSAVSRRLQYRRILFCRSKTANTAAIWPLVWILMTEVKKCVMQMWIWLKYFTVYMVYLLFLVLYSTFTCRSKCLEISTWNQTYWLYLLDNFDRHRSTPCHFLQAVWLWLPHSWFWLGSVQICFSNI